MARIDMTKATPGWWTEKHTSNWDHVKAAFERDWEQTKADFSKNGGKELNQEVGDTVKQSVGTAPIPPIDEKTRPNDPKKVAKTASRVHDKRDEKFDNAQKDLAAGGKSPGKIDGTPTWGDAEQELRYGYSVRSQYPNNSQWNETLESKLHGEWDELKTGHSWDDSRGEIRHGWDYAGRPV